MTLNRLTEKAQEAIEAAQQAAEQAGHPQVEPEHVLAALVGQPGGIAPEVLRKLGLDPKDVATAVGAALAGTPRTQGGASPVALRQTTPVALR